MDFIFTPYTDGQWMTDLKQSLCHQCEGGFLMDAAALTMYFTQYGGIAIFVIVFLEYLNLPGFPAGIIMPLAGLMAARGELPFLWVMAITVAAGLLGSLLLYFIGQKGGWLVMKLYLKHFPNQEEALQKSLDWVRLHGATGLFVAKLIPMLRTLISIPAGVMQMPLLSYIVSSTLGIAVWNLIFVGAGYLMGEQIFQWLDKL